MRSQYPSRVNARSAHRPLRFPCPAGGPDGLRGGRRPAFLAIRSAIRGDDREGSRFRNARAVDDQLSMSDATSRLIRECRLLGAANVIVSTNVAVTANPVRNGYRRVTSHGAGNGGAPRARPNARIVVGELLP